MPPQRDGFISIDWDPDPRILMAQFYSAAGAFQDFKEPLNRAVEEVVLPSIGTNFEVGGRPPWAPLSNETYIRDQYDTVPRQGILWKTATLKDAATSIRPWTADESSIYLVAGNLGDGWYGIIHQGGSQWMPARPWAVLQIEDEERIEELLSDWSVNTIVEIGLWGRTLGFVRGMFRRR